MATNDDYEMLPTHSVAVHMVAGAAAGIMEHCVMYPIDSVKVIFYKFLFIRFFVISNGIFYF